MIYRNESGLPALEYYSLQQFGSIVYDLFEPNSIVQINTLNEEDFNEIPLFRQLRFLINHLLENKRVKLTKIGNMPTALVKNLYDLSAREEYVESGFVRLTNEKHSIYVQLVHVLAKIMGVIKEQKGVMTLTKKGEKLASDNQKLLELLLNTFALKFNMGYFDLYENEMFGGFGIGFSFVLLSKYGDEEHLSDFYADKYAVAFPDLTANFELEPFAHGLNDCKYSCYCFRVFTRFMKPLGLIHMKEKKNPNGFRSLYEITKTPLFDKVIKVITPNELISH